VVQATEIFEMAIGQVAGQVPRPVEPGADGIVTLDVATTCLATFNPVQVPQVSLTLTKAGTGLGTVTSAPAGIDCGPDCSTQTAAFALNTEVTLTPIPASGSTFAGFSGDDADCADGIVTLDVATTCLATFNPVAADLAFISKIDSPDPVVVGGSLTYTPLFINNGPGTATSITLTDTLPAGVTFVSASEGCTEAGGTVTCGFGNLGIGTQFGPDIIVTPTVAGTLTNTAQVSSTAPDPNPANNAGSATTTVIPRPVILTVVADDGGTIGIVPPDVVCPPTCQVTYTPPAEVTLTAFPAEGWDFAAWSVEACGSTNPCTVSLTADLGVTATFVLIPTVTLTVQASGVIVTSNPAGINCPGDCTELYPVDTQVTLTGEPLGGSVLQWEGCDDIQDGACIVIMTTDTTVNAVGLIPIVSLNSAQFGYVVNHGDCTISKYIVDAATGQLRHNGYVVAGSAPLALAIDRSSRFAYVVNADSHDLSAYRINAKTGALTPFQGTPFPTGRTPVAVTLDPSGRFLYVANADSHDISAYQIDVKIGQLTAVPGAPYPAGESPRFVTVDPFARFVYVVNGDSHNISAYHIDTKTGGLRPVPGAPFPAGTTPMAAMIDPSGHFLYVANADSHDISAYTIDVKTGRLTPMPGAPFRAGKSPRSMSGDPSGHFLYVANADSHDISAYTIDVKTGRLTPLRDSPTAAGTTPMAATVDPTGRFLYVANADSHDVSAYTINSRTGTLTAAHTIRARNTAVSIAVSAGAQPVTFKPRFAYLTYQHAADPLEDKEDGATNSPRRQPRSLFSVVNNPTQLQPALSNPPANQSKDRNASISGYLVNARTGALTFLLDTSLPLGEGSNAVAADPAGRFLYVVNAGSRSISAYAIQSATGALKSLSDVPFPVEEGSPAIVVEASGRFVYVINRESQDVWAYAIDATTGGLTSLPESPFPAGASPGAATAEPTGRFLYVINKGSHDLSVFRIEPTSGVLIPLPGGPFTAGESPSAIAVEPSGRFLYALDSESHNVWAYGIDATTGALLPLVGSPFAAGEKPGAMAMEPSGRFLYVVNTGSEDLMAYAIDATTGILIPVPGFPLPVGEGPEALVVEPSGRFVYIINSGSQDIAGYAIDARNGTLAPLPGFPLLVGNPPSSLTMTGSPQ
jgi:6-phosphogluconolactonase